MKGLGNLSFTYSIAQAITAIDGRNRHKIASLSPYFSELSLNKYRLFIEIKYLEKLAEKKIIRLFSLKEKEFLEKVWKLFSDKDYQELRKIELKTNHDVKAVEEWLKKKLQKTSLKDIFSFVHFGLTSEDINNLAYGLMIKGALKEVLIPEIEKIKEFLKAKVKENKNLVMLSRTHGQPAVSTTLGKELLVYYERIDRELKILKIFKINGKLTGNVGNLNAHKFLYPKINWLKFSFDFIRSLGLIPDLITTQIEPYDSLIRIFQTILRINNILIGFCQDMWLYLMLGYFQQKIIKDEVGSTALPSKVNPIYFEGAEGGFGIANSLFEFYCRKFSSSRLQRDLSDSTIRRSFGIAFAYSLLSYQSLIEALSRIEPDREKINQDLNSHWEILSEAIQNFLKIKGYHDAYDKVKKYFRGKNLDKKIVAEFVNKLNITKEDKKKLLELSPEKYFGYAKDLVEEFT